MAAWVAIAIQMAIGLIGYGKVVATLDNQGQQLQDLRQDVRDLRNYTMRHGNGQKD